MAKAWKPKQFTWQIADPFDGVGKFARQLRISDILAQILHNRSCDDPETAKRFLEPKLTDLHDPTELPGATEAAQRIIAAVKAGKRIVIYGDYDVDGMTSVAILHACLKMLGADVHYYVPHRLDEGYGVNSQALEKLIAGGMGMMITVDCGITATGPVAEANAAGVEVIVTDHHLLGDELPEAAAIVHPALPGKHYPNPGLAGAGVAFKLAWQIARTACGTEKVDEPMRKFLLDATALAALGTIADVVPLTGENRAIAAFGLAGLSATDHTGLKALIRSAKLESEKLDSYHVGYLLAPRLNAAGRMGHARLAVELLTDPEPGRAEEIAKYLVTQNTERQKVERKIREQAFEMVIAKGLDKPSSHSIVLGSDQWHGGVIGIVASRLVEKFSRPTMLIAINGDGTGQGSGRSIAGFHIREALDGCSELLIGYGGHAMAAGLRISADKIDAFAEAFEAQAAMKIDDTELSPKMSIDVESSFNQLGYNTVNQLGKLGPFGQGNPRPVVAFMGCKLLGSPKRIGRSGQTVSMTLGQDGSRIRAVGFGMGDLADYLVGVNSIDVAAEPVLNSFNGRTSVELKLLDVRWD